MPRKNKTREYYAKKFEQQMERFNYVRQNDEEIIQCREGYPPYWFVSNQGYLLTAYYKEPRVVKPNFDATGKANNDGKRAGRGWRYATRYHGKFERYDMGRLMLDHFGNCEFDTDEKLVCHHIDKRNNYDPNDANRCNRADNLQLLPDDVHKTLTKYASKTSDQFDVELMDKIAESGCPILQFTGEQLERMVINAIKDCLAQGGHPVVYSTTIIDDVSKIKAEAHPVTSVG